MLSGLLRRDTKKQNVETKMQTREPESSPRDVIRIEQPERKEVSISGFRGASPRAWEWRAGDLKAPGAPADKYRPLSLEEEEPDEDAPQRVQSSSDAWVAEWLESVESGELDVYTCLGLSNAFSWSPDTRKILVKVVGVSVLQLVVPCILLLQETAHGVRFRPMVSNVGFRLIGMALYLYSVYSMYNNALDECRSRLLAFALRFQLPPGYWSPLLLGEFSNVFVSLVLVLTLYCIFTNVIDPADLILNAVAVNFLGSVDAEFVNDDMKKDALENFKNLTSSVLQYENNSDFGGDEDTESATFDQVLKMLLYGIAGTGVALGFLFLLCPSDENELDTRHVRGAGEMR